MQRIAKFHKVSFEQFKADWSDTFPVKAMIKCGCSIQSLLKYKICLGAGRLGLRIAYVP